MNTMTKLAQIWCALGAVLLFISACQPILVDTGSTGTQTDSSGNMTTIDAPEATEAETEQTDEIENAGIMADLSGVEQVLATRAVDELAAEMGIDADNVAVTEMVAVDWPDASLGCPEAGMMYAAVLTAGYKIMLEVNGEGFEYHSSNRENSSVVKCEQEK